MDYTGTPGEPSVVVEICEDLHRDGGASISVVTGGQALPVDVRLRYPQGEQALHAARGEVPDFAQLPAVTFDLPATAAGRSRSGPIS